MAGTTLGTAYVQIVPSAQGIKGSIEGLMGGEAESAGTSIGGKIGSFAKKALAAAAVGTAFVAGIKASMSEGAKLQQSYLGGLDTLYGEAADQARAYAQEASKMGISMNDYSEQAVSFGAALKQAYGGDTKKAVEAANTAIMDMTDNAAKMGTPIESVQQAYQGFAKGQYQLLDNLKLGYGGTKTEMERLLADAQKITGVKYDINNLGDVYDALHVVQGELGLTGVAAEEASQTLSGSFGAMKASIQNVFGSLALGENLQPALDQLLSTADTFFFNNFIPMVKTIISGLPTVIVTVFKQGIPTLFTRIIQLVKSLAMNLTKSANSLTSEKVKAWATTTIPKLLSSAGKLIGKFAKGLLDNLPKILLAIGKIGLNIVKGLGSALWPKIKEAARGIRDRFLEPIRALRDRVVEAISSLKERFLDRIRSLRDRAVEAVRALRDRAVDAAKALRDRFLAPIQALKERVNTAIQNLKDGFLNKVKAVRDTIGGIASSIKDKFLSPITTLKDKISAVVEKIKGFFSFSVKKPSIPLPHFSVTPAGWKLGDLLKGTMPHLGISWYAKGGIADKPIIGMGEAGPEAIVPLDPFWKRLDKMADNVKGGDITINVYAQPGMDVNELASAVERRLITAQKRRRNAWAY